MKKLLNRKEALGMIDKIFTSLHFNLILIKDLGIENSKERDYFLTEAWKIDQGRLKKDYEQTVNSLDAIGFKEYYKLIGKFATKYKIGCWKEYNEYEPILVEELNEELRKYDKTEDKLELINSFTVDELQSESFIFDSKVQVLYDILDDFNVGDNKEEGINTVLESFNSSDKASFIGKLQTDKNLLNALIDKVNGTQKDEMLALMGEMFISSGFITSQKQTLLGNEANDPISASFYKGDVNIILHSSLPSCSGIKKCITVSPFEIIGMNYDGREIQVPAFLLLNSWSNTFAEPEGIFFNYKHEDIDWNSLDEKQKDEYFYDFVAHYLPSGFIVALGNPIQIIIMSCIAILTGGLLAELQVALAAAGIVMSIADAKNAVGGIVQANKQKDASTTMHEAKKAAKVMAESIAKLTLDVINVICTVAGYFKGKKRLQRKDDIERFHLLSNENKESIFESLSSNELYEMIQKNPRYEWITKNYDLITKDNIKDIVILRKDGSLNLDWPKYAGLQLETVKSIGNMKGKIYVSRSGSPEGNTIGYGDTVEAWYASNSQRAIPSSTSEIQVGIMDVDKYKAGVEIISSDIDDYSKVIKLQKLGFSEDISDLLIRRYYEWNGKRFEIFGENGIIEGLKTINRTIDSIYGYSGIISPWEIGNLKMEGGCGQLNTVFSWQLLIDGGIVEYKTTIKIK